MIDYLLTGHEKFDSVIRAIARGRPGRMISPGDSFKGELAVIMSMHPGVFEMQQKARREGRPYLFIDHAYWQRGHDARNYRIVAGEVYNNHMVKRDHSRLFKWGARVSEARRGGGKYILVIMPSRNVAAMYGAEAVKEWLKETALSVKAARGLPIKLKYKNEGSFSEALEDAACVVSYASAADVEAVCAGVDGHFSSHSPAAPVSLHAESRPQRIDWAASLAWQQWNISEMEAGAHWPVYGV